MKTIQTKAVVAESGVLTVQMPGRLGLHPGQYRVAMVFAAETTKRSCRPVAHKRPTAKSKRLPSLDGIIGLVNARKDGAENHDQYICGQDSV